MDALDADDLYEERTSVSYARPILQGDVFDGVIIPGLGESPHTVQVVMHPCSMRRGSQLVERVQVAPVMPYQKVGDWNGHIRVMPLPDLREDGTHYAAKFVDKTAVPIGALRLELRVASLTHQGILVLQQRIVMDDTRLDVEIGPLRTQSAPVLAEAEMQETWIESRLGSSGTLNVEEVARAGDEFQAWLDEDDRKRRTELENEANHARLRKAVRESAAERNRRES